MHLIQVPQPSLHKNPLHLPDRLRGESLALGVMERLSTVPPLTRPSMLQRRRAAAQFCSAPVHLVHSRSASRAMSPFISIKARRSSRPIHGTATANTIHLNQTSGISTRTSVTAIGITV